MTIGAWDGAAILVKAIVYAATFGAAGGVFFLEYCRKQLSAHDYRLIQRLIGAFVIIGIMVGGARVLVLAGSMSGEIAGMLDRSMTWMIVHGREGQATGMRVAGLGLASLALLKHRRFPGAAIAGGVLASISFGWLGHAQAAAPRTPAILLIAVHLLGVAFWLGALMPLLIIARDPASCRIAAAAVRFGQAATVMVGLLLMAGLTLLWILLGTPSQLWMSDYGRLVMVKLGLVVGLLSLAAINRWRLTPRLRDRDQRAVRSLRRSIAVEMVLGGLILLVTATLTTVLGPPTE